MLALLSLSTLGSPVPALIDNEWAAWKQRHGKTYGSALEESSRKANWIAGFDFVQRHNALHHRSWTAGLNALSDLSWEEFKSEKLMTPQNCSATHKGSWQKKSLVEELPDAIDWRDTISKTTPWPVKNQGHCGSCWTFSTVGSLEAAYIIQHSAYKNLSEQQLVDCAGAFNNFGCNGGLPSQAFEYLHYSGGSDTETVYPYTAEDGTCKFDGKGEVQVTAIHNITAYDEDELLEAVGTVGPVSIAYQVSDDFRYYESGVYDGVCDDGPADVNHAVVAVGYGTMDEAAHTGSFATRGRTHLASTDISSSLAAKTSAGWQIAPRSQVWLELARGVTLRVHGSAALAAVVVRLMIRTRLLFRGSLQHDPARPGLDRDVDFAARGKSA
eukprot:CAMPEP_0115878096 /NCGR_PEP_ID=MMETSP0287-20121206/26588_1 /TAXON_ID=412157 /ORGANISM="Chrysochromulina rotalis, Strain UIO044" /LENGTH=383 /DNA_ID=CAMNT_0003333683 /DNA_START=17 /DNA_END=1170 /DNA_ORIENTATION=-